MAKGKVSKQNVGNSGEYYIASMLSARDYTVTITLGRNEKYDLLAVAPDGNTKKISVKTKYDSTKRFILNEKDEKNWKKDLFYCFVSLNGFKKEPDYWIIPSSIVSPHIWKTHREWKKKKSKSGKEHRDSQARGFNCLAHEYGLKGWAKKEHLWYKNPDALTRA